jgi:colanic acid biosynthesis protein WcaH
MSSQTNDLAEEQFAQIVRNAPLVSIDLVIRDPDGDILLGLRRNEPAKDFYFVPGGRIRKNETIEAAFGRILDVETGLPVDFGQARFLGVFQHIYAANSFGHDGYGTHYVVLAYELWLERRSLVALDDQHAGYKWMKRDELKAAPEVHELVKAYFHDDIASAVHPQMRTTGDMGALRGDADLTVARTNARR